MENRYGDKILYHDRAEAGEKLAEKLSLIRHEMYDPIVLGIPRGGVPIASAVARRLECPVDVVALRKLPIPGNPEAGFGAVTLDRTVVLNEPLVRQLEMDPKEIDRVVDQVYAEVERRGQAYRGDRLFPPLAGRSIIITDDGLASGYTMAAAVEFCRAKVPADVIVAVPVSHKEAYNLIKGKADKVISLYVSDSPAFAVASFYERFPDMTDEEVIGYL